VTVDLNQGYSRTLIEEADAIGMLRNQLAYVLATAQWETAHTMQPVKEAYWLSESWRKANLKYYPWYGRGFVQLTWEDNYKRADSELHLDGALVADPDLALEPSIAGMIILIGMTEGWFTGKKLSDYITLQKSDFVNARRIVNGTDQASTIASIASEYDAALLAEGYGVDYPEPAPPPAPAPQPTLDELIAQNADLNARVTALEDWARTQGMVIS